MSIDLILQKFGEETYHKKDFNNIYEYLEIVNYELRKYINRETLNLVYFNELLKNSVQYYTDFKKYFYTLTPDEVESLQAILDESFYLLERLKIDNLYRSEAKYYIFKFVDLIYNVSILYDFYKRMIPIVKMYYELDYKLQNVQHINLNTNEPLLKQVFYNQQPLTEELRNYFKEQLKGDLFEEILVKELDELLQFPSSDFWVWGLFNLIKRIVKENTLLIEYIQDRYKNIKDPFIRDLSYFQKYKDYDTYTIQLLKEKDCEIYKYKNFTQNDLNYIWMGKNLYDNILIPKGYFLSLKKALLKNPMQLNLFIKIAFLKLLNVAINVENLLYFVIMTFADDIFKAKFNYHKSLIENNLQTTLENPDKNSLGIYAALKYKDLLNGKITLDEFLNDKYNLVEILAEFNLLDKDIETEYHLIKNNIINKDTIIQKLNNFISTTLPELDDAFFVSQYYNSQPKLPVDNNQISSVKDLLPENQFLNKNDKKQENIELPDFEANPITDENINNKVDNIDTSFLSGVAVKNILKTKDVANNLLEITNTLPIVTKLNDNNALKSAIQDYSKNKDKITKDTLIKNLNTPQEINPNFEIKNNITKFINPDTIGDNTLFVDPDIIGFSSNLDPKAFTDSNSGSIKFFEELSDNITSIVGGVTDSITKNLLDPLNEYLDKLDKFNKQILEWIDKNIEKPIRNLVDSINGFIKKINKIMNNILNRVLSFINSIAKLFDDVWNSISNLISSILCVLKALLCLVAHILNLPKTFEDVLSNFKRELDLLTKSAYDSIDSLARSVLGVIDDLAETFDINIKGLCLNDAGSFTDQIKTEFMAFANEAKEKFMKNYRKMVDSAIKCKFRAPEFYFGRFEKFNFGFRPTLPPELILLIPKC
jgi:hypothetical protein